MDKQALNINPKNIKQRRAFHYYNYNFLDDSLTIDINIYYNLVSSLELFKLKNLYNFLFLRSLKLHDKFSTKKMKVEKYVNDPNELNNLLTSYISKDKLYSVIIINGIQQFFIPLNQ